MQNETLLTAATAHAMGVARLFTDLPALGEPFPSHVLMDTLGLVLAGLASTTQLPATMRISLISR